MFKPIFLTILIVFSLGANAANLNNPFLICKDIYKQATPYYSFVIEIDKVSQVAKVTVQELPFRGAVMRPKSFTLKGFEKASLDMNTTGDIIIKSAKEGTAGYTHLVPVDEKLVGDLVFPNSSQLKFNDEYLKDGDYLSLECKSFGL
ncbi:MAG: hypothetical protein HOE90_12715 [Bacteriovoracaceae bacterium]|jgi:hypothetical protein|nr:hypothetical protein [Bacteriovoracaceae bacterium]